MSSYAELIERGLASIQYPEVTPGLYEPVRYTLDCGGKRIRPQLVLMATSLFTEDVSVALSPALGIEMFHNFTLLHDDVMDKAPERRGKATVHIKWNESQAILSGDAMLGLAYQLIAESPASVMKSVMDIFNVMNQEICQGQQLDMVFETRDDVTIEEYTEMIRLKTSVLLGRALQIGAIIGLDKAMRDAGQDLRHCNREAIASDINALYTFGEQLGLAFQLQDDWLDCWGNPETFGKRIGGDILCQKKTYLRIVAMEIANGRGMEVPKSPWAGMTPEEEQEVIEAWKAFYVATGAEDICRRAVETRTDMAVEALNSMHVDAESLQPLHALADKLLNRKV